MRGWNINQQRLKRKLRNPYLIKNYKITKESVVEKEENLAPNNLAHILNDKILSINGLQGHQAPVMNLAPLKLELLLSCLSSSTTKIRLHQQHVEAI